MVFQVEFKCISLKTDPRLPFSLYPLPRPLPSLSLIMAQLTAALESYHPPAPLCSCVVSGLGYSVPPFPSPLGSPIFSSALLPELCFLFRKLLVASGMAPQLPRWAQACLRHPGLLSATPSATVGAHACSPCCSPRHCPDCAFTDSPPTTQGDAKVDYVEFKVYK